MPEQNKYTISRRSFLKSIGLAGAGLGAASLLNSIPVMAKKPVPAGQVQLGGNKIPQFIDPLPRLSADGGTMETVIAGTDEITLNMLEFKANMMPSTFVPANGLPYSGTWVFGYRNGPTTAPATAVDTYIGPVIVATRGTPTQVRYVNNLTANNIAWRSWTDMSLHSAFHQAYNVAMPSLGDNAHYQGPVLAVPHLHGGEVPALIDGGPEAWFASNGGGGAIDLNHGPAYYAGVDVAGGGANPPAANECIYRYPNSQEAAPLWFHDHLLGGTRLNATFAGLAGAYSLIDPGMTFPTGLGPVDIGGRLLIPLVLQDRMFDTNGQLFFPTVGINPEHPWWVPEFVGDTIVVNGKVWPYLNVDQQRYRFYVINGSNSRGYDMYFQDLLSGIKGPRFWVIATDGGYLDAPVLIDPNATGQQVMAGQQQSLMMMPGERYSIIVDFADPIWLAAMAAAGATFPVNLILRNRAPTVNGNPKQSTEGRIMQFRVSANAPVDTSYDPASAVPLRTPMVRLADPVAGTLAAGVTAAKTRFFTLNEIVGAGGPLEALVNNSKWSGKRDMAGTPVNGGVSVGPGMFNNFLTEFPLEGDTEVWEIANLTMDSHPIHLHAIQFQLINREPFNMAAFMAAYDMLFPGGMFVPGYGPPLAYSPSDAAYDATLQAGKYGGNPDNAPYLLGAPLPPLGYEAGWKDTVIMHPGEITRIAVRWAPQSFAAGAAANFEFIPNAGDAPYVWHCHITDHEDNEMMRPDWITSNGAGRTYVQGTDY